MVGEGERLSQECPSSVLTVSTPPPTLRLSPYYGSPTQCTQSLLERKQKDRCFRCRKQGHWAEDCHGSPTGRTQSLLERKRKDICFRCGKQGHWAEDCDGIPNRCTQSLLERKQKDRCFRCGKQGHWAEDCRGSPTQCTQSLIERKQKDTCFRCGKQGHWAEDCLSGTKTKASPPVDINQQPVLRCHWGVVCTMSFSSLESCYSYTGHGACGFLQFDSPPNSCPWSSEKDERPAISSPPNGEPTNVMAHEDECPKPSFSNRDVVVRDSETFNPVVGKGHSVSRLLSRSDIRSRQIEFWNQISAAANSPDRREVFQMLGFDFHGWLGRPSFPPPRILEEALPRHFFCELVSAYVDVSNGGESSSTIPHAFSNAEVNALINDTELPSVPLRTSRLKRSFTAMQADVINPRKKPEKDVLCLLESVETADDDTMSQATNATSDALARAESIQCTARVSQVESTIQDNCNLQVPTIDIFGIHAEAFTAQSAASGNYLQSVHSAMASHFKDMLGQFEKLETCLLDIAKDMGQSKRRMQATYQELTEAWKLQQEEEEQCMARRRIRRGKNSP